MMIDIFKNKIPRDRLLMPGTEKKIGKEPLTEEPVTRNPLGIPMFDKSLYFAVFYILDNLRYQTVMRSKRYYSVSRVLVSVTDFDKLMLQRAHVEKAEREKKKREKAREAKAISTDVENNRKMNTSGKMLSMKSAIRANRTSKSMSKSTGTKQPKSTKRG